MSLLVLRTRKEQGSLHLVCIPCSSWRNSGDQRGPSCPARSRGEPPHSSRCNTGGPDERGGHLSEKCLSGRIWSHRTFQHRQSHYLDSVNIRQDGKYSGCPNEEANLPLSVEAYLGMICYWWDNIYTRHIRLFGSRLVQERTSPSAWR